MFPRTFKLYDNCFVFWFFFQIQVRRLRLKPITSAQVRLSYFIEPTHLALSPLTNMNFMFSIASAIYEDIDTLVWLSLSMSCKVFWSLTFYLGNHSYESSYFRPIYQIRSWKTSPRVLMQSDRIQILPSLDMKFIYSGILSQELQNFILRLGCCSSFVLSSSVHLKKKHWLNHLIQRAFLSTQLNRTPPCIFYFIYYVVPNFQNLGKVILKPRVQYILEVKLECTKMQQFISPKIMFSALKRYFTQFVLSKKTGITASSKVSPLMYPLKHCIQMVSPPGS